MMKIEDLQQGIVLSNNQLKEIFQCGNMGGMRRSHATNTLVLICDHTKSLYNDSWAGDILHYTGMGKIGDQSLSSAQNRTLAESTKNGISIHLFEVFRPGDYCYQGQVELTNKPYLTSQLDDNNEIRNVWMFPLKLIGNSPIKASQEEISSLNQFKQKAISKKEIAFIKAAAESVSHTLPGERQTNVIEYDRNPFVREYALRRAAGYCQLCDKPAPFKNKLGLPYLEVHHIQYLSKGGLDIIENVVALCPNCHARMHSLEIESEEQQLKLLATVKL